MTGPTLLTTSDRQLAAAIEHAETPDAETRLELYRQMQALVPQCVRTTTRLAPIVDTTTPWSVAFQ